MVGGPYRGDIQTVHVPIFTSSSFRRDVELQLTEAVQKEIQQQTHFRLAKAPYADTELRGHIVQINKNVLGESAFDDPRELQYSLAVQVTWTDLRTGREEQRQIQIAPDLVHLLSTADYAPELGQSMATARQQAVQRLARQIVRMMQTPW
ncbi:MAG: LPS assembly lipoprotein LptE [Planctomycetaceae bacterium]